jgi:hypothetical protein
LKALVKEAVGLCYRVGYNEPGLITRVKIELRAPRDRVFAQHECSTTIG